MTSLTDIQALVQESIDKGATSIEEVHKSIANMPLDFLAKIGPFADAAKQGKEFQTQTIGSVYENIRLMNQKVGEVASQLLNKK